jgi:predicted kinase
MIAMTRAIVITGLPCAGKSSLACYLHKALELPMASKDIFKEILFDTLGCRDRAWSRQLDAPSVALLFQFLETHLTVGQCCIIDHWFDSELDVQHLSAMQVELKFEVIQVLCHAPGPILLSRFSARAAAGRHEGHCDQFTYEEHKEFIMAGRMKPLSVVGALIELDTSDFGMVAFDSIAAKIKVLLEQG